MKLHFFFHCEIIQRNFSIKIFILLKSIKKKTSNTFMQRKNSFKKYKSNKRSIPQSLDLSLMIKSKEVLNIIYDEILTN